MYEEIAAAIMASSVSKHLKEIRRGLLESGNLQKQQRLGRRPGSSHKQPQANGMCRRMLSAVVCVEEHSHPPGNKNFHSQKPLLGGAVTQNMNGVFHKHLPDVS